MPSFEKAVRRARGERLFETMLTITEQGSPYEILKTAIREMGGAMGVRQWLYRTHDAELAIALVDIGWREELFNTEDIRTIISNFADCKEPELTAEQAYRLLCACQDMYNKLMGQDDPPSEFTELFWIIVRSQEERWMRRARLILGSNRLDETLKSFLFKEISSPALQTPA